MCCTGGCRGFHLGWHAALWSMFLEREVTVLASSSSSEGKSPLSGSSGSSLISCGADGRGGDGEMSWVGGWMGGGVVVLGVGM